MRTFIKGAARNLAAITPLLVLALTYASGDSAARQDAGAVVVPPPRLSFQHGNAFASESHLIWTEVGRSPEGRTTWEANDVMGLDLRTNTPIAVAVAPGSQTALGISGSIALWTSRDDSCPECSDDVFARDLATGQVYAVATGKGRQDRAAISGRIVVWVELDGGPAERLLMRELDGGEPRELARLPIAEKFSFSPPQISQEYVAWSEDWSGSFREPPTGPSRLRVHDRTTGETRTLLEYRRPYEGRVQYALAGRRLVWIETHVHYLDLSTSRKLEIDPETGRKLDPDQPNVYVTAPSLAGDLIFWSAGDPSNLDLYAATAADGKPLMLAGGEGNQASPVVIADTLVWLNSGRRGSDLLSTTSLSQALDRARKRDAALQPLAAAPGGDMLFFPETGHSLRGRFREYWEQNGGLAQQGYPLSEEFEEVSPINGKVYTVQYFERAVFEKHPENNRPYDVLLSLLGREEYVERHRPSDLNPAGAPGQRPSKLNPRYFEQTGKTLGGVFREYWERNGGLAQQGYPISDEFVERSELDGRTYTVQYFERAVFEHHPENAGTPYEVLLSQLGRFALHKRYGLARDARPAPQPTPVATPSGRRITWEHLNAVSAVSSDDVWAMGANGTILHYDGQRWSEAPSPTTADLSALDMISAEEGWAVGEDVILHYRGGRWILAEHPPLGSTAFGGLSAAAQPFTPTPGPQPYLLTDVDMISHDEGWATCANCRSNMLRYHAGRWEEAPIYGRLAGLSFGPEGDGWAVGGTMLLRYSGGRWTGAQTGDFRWFALHAVRTLSSGEAWFLGDAIFHYLDGKWEMHQVQGLVAGLRDLDMASRAEGWAVGGRGGIAYYAEGRWTPAASPISDTLNAVEMISPRDGWAVGESGVILRNTDGTWREYQQP